MRRPREILDRLWQEFVNIRIWLFPPRLPRGFSPSSPLPPLPAPSRVAALLAGTSFPGELLTFAREILAHRFPLPGLELEAGPDIRWRKDYANAVETGLPYFRMVPYLNVRRAGDHKIIWELNRHQHLVLLAQLYQFDADPALLAEIWRELKSWLDANPFQRGINWASALEVAFRAFSWIWIYHLVGREMPAALRRRFLESLIRHGRHIEVNLSFYFSPNTHLLGEAVVLHALGLLFPEIPNAQRWRDLGSRVVSNQLDLQVRNDGAHFEQSTYYHVYALDMFLFHGILAGAGEAYRARVARMADYLAAVQGPARVLPFIGDDDGGRFFHPFGVRRMFGRATVATCAVWLDRPAWPYVRQDLFPQAAWWLERGEGSASVASLSRLFPDTGMAVMTAPDRHILIDVGPFGPWGSGHSHSDTLSIVARAGDREILIDSGTYTYVGDPAARNWFRGSAAHSTIRIDGRDQANPVNPFRWSDQPAVSVRAWTTSDSDDSLDAQCTSRGFTHRRRVRYIKPDLLLIVDDVSGPPGQHTIEQFWHLDSSEDVKRITVEGATDLTESWRSDVFGARRPSVTLVVRRECALPIRWAAAIHLGNCPSPVSIERSEAGILFGAPGLQLTWELRECG
jgi:Heparinase II/III-like protein/Heparinase II/III N-terminus